jgi:hypothetical protein
LSPDKIYHTKVTEGTKGTMDSQRTQRV